MPGHVRNKNLQYDDDDFYDEDDYYEDDYDEAGYYDEPVAQPQPPPAKPTVRKDYFAGIPWGHIPPHRMSRMLEDRQGPRGRLLGGSGKPSKLQALAAQRRKQQEDNKTQGNHVDQQNGRATNGSSLAILDKLNAHSGTRGEEYGQRDDRQSLNGPSSHRYKRQKMETLESEGTPVLEDRASTHVQDQDEPPAAAYDLRAGPSKFANGLLGAPKSSQQLQDAHGYHVRATAKADTNPFAGPSPDDIVSKAQSRPTQHQPKKPPSTKTANGKTSTNGVTQGVAALKVAEAPTIKSKNLDVPAEYERSNNRGSANFVVIGHVDHGKSTLMGRLLLDLKHPSLSQRDFEKQQRAAEAAGKGSFALAWTMDARSDEREHGVTIDYATQHFSTEKTDFTILDSPGHQDFIKNMIAGTSQADFAVLVVDASTDAFEAGLRGQTREHAMLARSMGISKMVVAVNKMDAASWSKDRFDEVVAQLQGFFTAAGFNKKNIAFVPCAGLTGDNVAKGLSGERKKQAAWYDGLTLVQVLEQCEPRQRRIRDPLRITLSDRFVNTMSGAPTGDVSVTGLIDAGNVQVGTKVLAQPSGNAGTVKSIEMGGQPREWAIAGQIITLNLVGIQEEHLKAGDVLCERGNKEIQNVRTITAKCLAFETMLPTRLALHRGQIYCSAKVQFLHLEKDNKAASNGTGTTQRHKKPPRVVKAQQTFRVLIELYDDERGLPLDVDDRVVLRESGRTMATGIIDGIEEYVKQ